MSICDRVREIRKKNKISQAAFGESLGVSRDVINDVENDRVTPKELFLQHLCSVYNISKTWLREGTGEMFVEDENILLSSLSQEYGLDGLDQKIIEAYINLPDIQRGVIKGFVRNLIDSVLSDDNFKEYREDYVKVKAAPIAARQGNIEGLQKAVAHHDKATKGDKGE